MTALNRTMSSSVPSDFKMEYRLLGDTGLKVSVLGMGAMTYDTVEKTIKFMKCVRKYGVNFFDNAEAYGNPIRGIAETNFGKALKILQKEDPKLWRRSDLVLTTKLFWGLFSISIHHLHHSCIQKQKKIHKHNKRSSSRRYSTWTS